MDALNQKMGRGGISRRAGNCLPLVDEGHPQIAALHHRLEAAGDRPGPGGAMQRLWFALPANMRSFITMPCGIH